MIIRSRAPLRLGFGGGGTDLSPFCDLYGGQVLNATIDMYAYAIIETRGDMKLRFAAGDIDVASEAEASLDPAIDRRLMLQKAVYQRIMQQYCDGEAVPLTLTTYCDAPPG